MHPRWCLEGFHSKPLCKFQGLFGSHNGKKLMLWIRIQKMESLTFSEALMGLNNEHFIGRIYDLDSVFQELLKVHIFG